MIYVCALYGIIIDIDPQEQKNATKITNSRRWYYSEDDDDEDDDVIMVPFHPGGVLNIFFLGILEDFVVIFWRGFITHMIFVMLIISSCHFQSPGLPCRQYQNDPTWAIFFVMVWWWWLMTCVCTCRWDCDGVYVILLLKIPNPQKILVYLQTKKHNKFSKSDFEYDSDSRKRRQLQSCLMHVRISWQWSRENALNNFLYLRLIFLRSFKESENIIYHSLRAKREE